MSYRGFATLLLVMATLLSASAFNESGIGDKIASSYYDVKLSQDRTYSAIAQQLEKGAHTLQYVFSYKHRENTPYPNMTCKLKLPSTPASATLLAAELGLDKLVVTDDYRDAVIRGAGCVIMDVVDWLLSDATAAEKRRYGDWYVVLRAIIANADNQEYFGRVLQHRDVCEYEDGLTKQKCVAIAESAKLTAANPTNPKLLHINTLNINILEAVVVSAKYYQTTEQAEIVGVPTPPSEHHEQIGEAGICLMSPSRMFEHSTEWVYDYLIWNAAFIIATRPKHLIVMYLLKLTLPELDHPSELWYSHRAVSLAATIYATTQPNPLGFPLSKTRQEITARHIGNLTCQTVDSAEAFAERLECACELHVPDDWYRDVSKIDWQCIQFCVLPIVGVLSMLAVEVHIGLPTLADSTAERAATFWKIGQILMPFATLAAFARPSAFSLVLLAMAAHYYGLPIAWSHLMGGVEENRMSRYVAVANGFALCIHHTGMLMAMIGIMNGLLSWGYRLQSIAIILSLQHVCDFFAFTCLYAPCVLLLECLFQFVSYTLILRDRPTWAEFIPTCLLLLAHYIFLVHGAYQMLVTSSESRQRTKARTLRFIAAMETQYPTEAGQFDLVPWQFVDRLICILASQAVHSFGDWRRMLAEEDWCQKQTFMCFGNHCYDATMFADIDCEVGYSNNRGKMPTQNMDEACASWHTDESLSQQHVLTCNPNPLNTTRIQPNERSDKPVNEFEPGVHNTLANGFPEATSTPGEHEQNLPAPRIIRRLSYHEHKQRINNEHKQRVMKRQLGKQAEQCLMRSYSNLS